MARQGEGIKVNWLRISRYLSVVLFAFGICRTASAAIWAEVGDAGDLLPTSNLIFPDNPVTNVSAITGSLSANPADGPDYVDLFRFYIGDGTAFSAGTGDGGDPNLIADPVLYLFDALGKAVFMDDEGGGFGQAQLGALPTGYGSGFYYLVIAYAGTTPLDGLGGDMFDAFGSLAVLSTDSLAGWTGGPFSPNFDLEGHYLISLTGVTNVPEPGTLLLLLSAGIIALRVQRRR